MIWVLAIYSIMLSVVCAILSNGLFKAKQVDKAQEELIKAQQQKINLLELTIKDLDEECDELTEMLEGTVIAKVKAAFGDYSVQAEGSSIQDAVTNLMRLRDESEKAFEENLDPRDKEIGDKVKLWNYYLAKKEDQKSDFKALEYAELEAIVIKKDLDIPVNGILGMPSTLDTAIKYPDGTVVYTKAEYIKRTDTYEK